GAWQLVVILVVALFIFGPRKIPEIARAIGRSIVEFRNAGRQADGETKAEIGAEGVGPPSGRV
ncbi:MAG: twin-arginine translocase TatA/TatE family subunit, partial [Firmicutes bacterium]|nr:twin-arginine translocase TatA/TatE family subunit [Bacillota bacterium]